MSKYLSYLYSILAVLAILLVILIYDPGRLFGSNRDGSDLVFVAFSMYFISLTALMALLIPSVRRVVWIEGRNTVVILSLMILAAYIVWGTNLLVGFLTATDL